MELFAKPYFCINRENYIMAEECSTDIITNIINIHQSAGTVNSS